MRDAAPPQTGREAGSDSPGPSDHQWCPSSEVCLRCLLLGPGAGGIYRHLRGYTPGQTPAWIFSETVVVGAASTTGCRSGLVSRTLTHATTLPARRRPPRPSRPHWPCETCGPCPAPSDSARASSRTSWTVPDHCSRRSRVRRAAGVLLLEGHRGEGSPPASGVQAPEPARRSCTPSSASRIPVSWPVPFATAR